MPDCPPPSQEEALSLKLSILEELINSEILLQRAAKMNLVASDAEVEDKFTRIEEPLHRRGISKKLKDSGLTVDDLKSNIRRQLSIQKLLNREVVAKIPITDQDIADFYNQNKSQFNLPEPQYHIAEIVVTPRPDPTVHNRKNDKAGNEAQAGRKAAMLEQKLSAGADFAQLAMDYSEDSTRIHGRRSRFTTRIRASTRSDPLLKKRACHEGGRGQSASPAESWRTNIETARERSRPASANSPTRKSARNPQMLRSRKEQLCASAYLAEARNESHVTNYLARQILESAGKLPEDQYR